MHPRPRVFALLLLASLGVPSLKAAETARALFYRAHYLETAEKNPTEAARLYQLAIDAPDADASLKAEAASQLRGLREDPSS
jgi:hypothetical protein